MYKERSKLKVIIYPIIVLLVAITIIVFTNHTQASEYVTNFQRIPAIERSPPKLADWTYTPTVLVCEHAPVEESDVRRAVRFWENKGFKFYRTIFKKDDLDKCKNPNPKGFVVIKLVSKEVLANMAEASLAETHFYVNNDTNKIEWAIIYLPRTPQIRVLEHELGHTLGFLHHNKKGHIMHEKWIQGGWDDDGLRR